MLFGLIPRIAGIAWTFSANVANGCLEVQLLQKNASCYAIGEIDKSRICCCSNMMTS